MKLAIKEAWENKHYYEFSLRLLAIIFTVLIALACALATGYAMLLLWGPVAAGVFGFAGFVVNLVIFWSETQDTAILLGTGKFWHGSKNKDITGVKNSWPKIGLLGLALAVAVGCGFVSFGFNIVASHAIFLAIGLGASASGVLPFIIASAMAVGMTLIVFSSIFPAVDDPTRVKKFLQETFCYQKKDSALSYTIRLFLITASVGIALFATLATVNAWGDKLMVAIDKIPAISVHAADTIVAAFVWIAFAGNLIFNATALIKFSKLMIKIGSNIKKSWYGFLKWAEKHEIPKPVVCLLVVACAVLIVLNGICNGALARLGKSVLGPIGNMIFDAIRSTATGAAYAYDQAPGSASLDHQGGAPLPPDNALNDGVLSASPEHLSNKHK